MPYDFTHMWNLRNKTSKGRKKEKEKPTEKQTLNYEEQTNGYQRGGGGRMGETGEGN